MLEPTMGIGNIINYANIQNPKLKITGYELLDNIFDITKRLLLIDVLVELMMADTIEA